METGNNQGNPSLPSAAPVPGDEEAGPLKLQLEVTLPRELGGELKAWRRAFERFTDVMGRWLESSLSQHGLPAPPMPWISAAAPAPQPLAPLPSAPAAPTVETGSPTVETPAPVLSAPQAAPAEGGAESRSEAERMAGASAPASKLILPDEMPPLLVEDTPPRLAAPPAQEAPVEADAARPIAEARPIPAASETEETAPAADSVAAHLAVLQVQQGEQHRLAGDKEKALACYREALNHAPSCVQAYLGRARIYMEQGRHHEAVLDCSSALRYEPKRALFHVLRGLAYERLGNLKRALDEAEDAVRLDSRLPSAYLLRGKVRLKKGMQGEALADIEEAIRLRPDDALYRAELARFLAETGQHAQAARVYAEVLELAPDFHAARLQRGSMLRLAGEAAKAEAELTRYLRRCPRTAAAYYQRGLCRLAQRNYAQAMTDFDKAIGLNPNDEATRQAKQMTLRQWEETARQSRPESSWATGGQAATVVDSAAAEPTRPAAVPLKPMPAKASPAKPKPGPARSSPRRDDDEPPRWRRPAKWACSLVLVGLLGYQFVPMVWAYVKIRSIPQEESGIPEPEAKVTAPELWQRYHTNLGSAERVLGQRYIQVRGIVWEVKQGRSGEKDVNQIVLVGNQYGGMVVCTLVPTKTLNQGARLSRVDRMGTVTVIGKCAGMEDKNVNLDEVRLIEVRSR